MSSEYLTCKQAARLLDVSPSTIKRLCDENRLVSLRTPGGHRRISLRSVQECQSQARIFEQQSLIGKRESNTALNYHECARLLSQCEELEIARTIERSRQRYSVVELCDHVFAPAIIQLAAAEARGELPMSRVVVASQRLRRILYDFGRTLPQPGATAPIAIGAHVAGDPADLASLMVEVTLRELGWRAQSLGMGLDGKTLGEAAQEMGASIVWVCYVHQQPTEQLVAHNSLLREHMPPTARLIIGGGALTAQVRRLLSFHFFGDSLLQLSQLLGHAGEHNASAA